MEAIKRKEERGRCNRKVGGKMRGSKTRRGGGEEEGRRRRGGEEEEDGRGG